MNNDDRRATRWPDFSYIWREVVSGSGGYCLDAIQQIPTGATGVRPRFGWKTINNPQTLERP